MPIVDHPDELPLLREELRHARMPYLFHSYDATVEDYEQITDEDLKCEFVDGELIVHSPTSIRHESLAGFVLSLVREFVTERRLGDVFGSNAVMQLGERRFSPDVSALLAANAGRVQNNRIVGPADLVVEILSSSTRAYDRNTKLPLYCEGRVGEIWLIDADRRQFEAHAWRDGGYVSQALTTGRWASITLPDLSVDVEWFWLAPLPSVSECRIKP